jgi:hypothetical protein
VQGVLACGGQHYPGLPAAGGCPARRGHRGPAARLGPGSIRWPAGRPRARRVPPDSASTPRVSRGLGAVRHRTGRPRSRASASGRERSLAGALLVTAGPVGA